MKFDLPKDSPSIIKVLGVGGGGSNAVNHMYRQGIKGVDFIICNTDNQALEASPVEHKIQLGVSLTEGRGAGSLPEVGKNSAIETIDTIREQLAQTAKMVFITAGMGGGTGTGAAPIIAEAAREQGILTVGIVTMPFFFEGRKRKQQAEEGIKAIREHVDTLLVINNDRLREMYGDLKMSDAFAQADNVLTTAAKGIAEIITRTGHVNVDFEDVRTVMRDSGVAVMGSATASGENRSISGIEKALASPLLNDNDIRGARYVLLNMEYGSDELTMDEIADITDYIQDEAGSTADVIWGYGSDETLGDELRVTIIATGFQTQPSAGVEALEKPEQVKRHTLTDDVKTELTQPVNRPVEPKQPTVKPTEEPFLREATPEPEKEDPTVQGTIEFNLTKQEPAPVPTPPASDSFEPYVKQVDQPEEPPVTPPVSSQPVSEAPAEQPAESTPAEEGPMSMEEQQARAKERMKRLGDISMRLRNPQGISDLENVPAYKRREVRLDDVPHSSESQVSRFTLSEEEDLSGEKRTGIRPNNSFLHDNVD